jgi:cysteinyl-tRNA synthetase
MPLRIYNSLSRRIEEFRPLDPRGTRVTFYSCGPTVYDYAHIGNFRSFLNADLLRRALELFGYEVAHVMNMTDVGHMTEDDAGRASSRRKPRASIPPTPMPSPISTPRRSSRTPAHSAWPWRSKPRSARS